MDSDATSSKEGKLSKKSSSFRLRSSSLNSVRLRRVFDLFDKNGDGVITADEIGKALVLLGLEADPSETALESITNSFVKPGNPGLTFEDFESLHKSLDEALFDGSGDDPDAETSYNSDSRDNGQEIQEDPISQEESDLTEAFKVFDVDGDGYISAKELQVVLEKLGLPEAGEMDRVERMISSVDRNADGLVDFFEFKDMMRSVMVRSS